MSSHEMAAVHNRGLSRLYLVNISLCDSCGMPIAPSGVLQVLKVT